jgi:hypothetical protein
MNLDPMDWAVCKSTGFAVDWKNSPKMMMQSKKVLFIKMEFKNVNSNVAQ